MCQFLRADPSRVWCGALVWVEVVLLRGLVEPKERETMKKLPLEALESLLHLDEEELVIAAGEGVDAPLVVAHLDACEVCRGRVRDARDILQVEPFERRSSPENLRHLMDRLTAVGAIAPNPARSAFVRVAIVGEALHVLETDTQIRIGAAVATRSTDPVGASPGVTFFRRLAGVEIELHLVRVPGGTFHLVVGIDGEGGAQWRVVLHRGHRELAVSPAPHGAVTFKSLKPARYRLEIQDRGVAQGFLDVDVEAQSGLEGER